MKDHIELIVGMQASHVWRGYGSAIFVEFGELTERFKRDGSLSGKEGEFTLMIEWSWRIEKARSILTGSFSEEKKWMPVLQKVVGSSVERIEFFGHIPEIMVTFSNGFRVVSFMTEKGQPSWALLSQNKRLGTLCVKRGRLNVERESD